MSAEQQKILWIIAAVSLVIVIVLAVGLWWFYPGRKSAAAVTAIPADAVTTTTVPAAAGTGDLNDWVKPEPEKPADQPAETTASDGPTVVVIYADGTQAPAAESEARTSSGGAWEGEKQSGAAESTPAETGKPAPAPVKKPATKKSAPASTGTVKTAAKPSVVKVDEYWIQTASVSSISRAEEVKTLLQEKGLSPVIMPITVNDNNFYRVRIGPYTKKEEAEKFLEWIKKVKSLEQSYISLVKATRTRD